MTPALPADTRPPAQPTAILRGHGTQVHAAAFVRTAPSAAAEDRRLATGDGDGFVVLWDLAIVRPRAVWRAHQNSILGLAGWDADDQIVTHGRDHKLIVWQVRASDEARLSTALPLDGRAAGGGGGTGTKDDDDDGRPQPWMVHVLEVNTMNFCAFAWCVAAETRAPATEAGTAAAVERLVAVPNALSLEVNEADLYHLPSQRRINTIRLGTKEGMIMALGLAYVGGGRDGDGDGDGDGADDRPPPTLVVLAAFENGVVVVASLDDGATGAATLRYRAQAHSQPVLALDMAPDRSYFVTSAADAVLAKHPIPVPAQAARGQPAAEPAAAPSTPTPVPASEAAAAAAAPTKPTKSLLSAALAKEAAATSAAPTAGSPSAEPPLETQPLKTVNTKHAGQQGLRMRSDGRLFATAGWDGRVRVYAAKTLREVAVLKWHQAGCFAVAFAPVGGGPDSQRAAQQAAASIEAAPSEGGSQAVVRPAEQQLARPGEVSVKERRLRHAVTAHWLAAGSKDGKVSLWDVF